MKKYILIFLGSFLLFTNIFSQSNIRQLTNDLTESITLSLDRTTYLSGEKIWFKAQGFIPLDLPDMRLSNVLYIELFNSSNNSYIRKKFRVKDDILTGMFEIPTELNSGNYFIRAYTQYNRNSLTETIFTQKITIVNPTINLPNQVFSTNNIKIMPEYGSLIQGISNNIIINVGQGNRNLTSKIWISDELGSEITNTNTEDGIGLLQITPSANMSYFAHTTINNDTIITEIPKANTEGIFMKSELMRLSNQIDLLITNLQTKLTQVKLELYSKHFNKLSERQVFLQSKENHLAFELSSLLPGFNYFVIRDSKNAILSIHCYYKLPIEITPLKITTDQQKYTRRDKIELDISLGTKLDENIDLSISVTKKGTFETNEKGLPNYLFSNPYLIESYLISNPDVIKNTPFDIEKLLMAYNSKLANDINFKNRLTVFHYNLEWVPEIRDVSLSGYVRNKNTKEPIAGTEVYLSVFKTNPQVHLYKTDMNGYFIFSLNNLTEIQDVFITVNKKIDDQEELELVINNDFLREYPSYENIPFNLTVDQTPLIEELYVNTQATKIFKTEPISEPISPVAIPYAFSNPEFSINLDDYISSPSLEVVFRELIPAVRLRKTGDTYKLSVSDPKRKGFLSNPLIMVDYITIFDIKELMSINVSKIQKIDVFTTPYVLGNAQFGGVILLTTKTDNFGGMKMPAESSFFEYSTISDSYQFDPPVYDTPQKTKNRKADFRNLLYWNPSVKIKDRKKINFYTSDHCSEYDIIVRGFTKDGKWYFGKHEIKVE